MLVAVGFLMLLLTSLQGWGMVGIVALSDRPALIHDFRRLHNLGLSGGFLAISFGLSLIVLPQPERRVKVICKILLPSLLLAPVAFSDRSLVIVLGKIPFVLQALFFGLQAVSALGISASLAMMVVFLLKKPPNP
jgi:hypothetical protein